jgi:hypothetical protein
MSSPTATTKPVVPTSGKVGRPPAPLRVHRGAPVPHDLQLLLQDLYQCQDCSSEVRWDLRVGIGHDPGCPAQRGVI